MARLKARTLKDAVTVPASAVQLGMRGTYVYVIDEKGVARVREVTPGITAGTVSVIARGLRADERVVTDGVDRLRDGLIATIAASAETPAVEQ